MPDADFLQLVECPRDAMQGWPITIPTETKVAYLTALMEVGFHTIDFGSFVSPRAIPQMADTASVLAQIEKKISRSALLAIVANVRGAETATSYDAIRYIGFPFSVSETFQQRNTNSSIRDSLSTVEQCQELCVQRGKELVVYLSMGFGNPYGDPWSETIVLDWARKIADLGITTLSLADTVGLATPSQVETVTGLLIREFPSLTIGVHLHATPGNWREKVKAAYAAGCRRFDGALKGIGGCPMAGDALVGNLDTLNLIDFCQQEKIPLTLNETALEAATRLANQIFSANH